MIPLTEKLLHVFSILSGAASRGEICPTNREIGNMLGSVSLDAAADRFNRLAQTGLIAVARYGAWRVVTICATGQKTATPPQNSEPVPAPTWAPGFPSRETRARAIAEATGCNWQTVILGDGRRADDALGKRKDAA